MYGHIRTLLPCLVSLLMASVLDAADGDYPSWMGPDGSRSSDAGLRLVDDESKARVLWKSEITLPRVYADPSSPASFPITHYCSPVVADGLVYYVYPDPTQSAPLDAVLMEKVSRGKNPEDAAVAERGCRQRADDLIICMNAETGKTEWTRRFVGKGANPIYNITYHATPVIADGRCYVQGSFGWLYALDAKTGEPVWESELADSRAYWEERFALWLAGPYEDTLAKLRSGELKGYKEHYILGGMNMPSPVLVDGVLVCVDMAGKPSRDKYKIATTNNPGRALVGIDAQTGRQVWRTPCGATGAPKVWTRSDGSSVIATSSGGYVCVEAKSGALQWRSKSQNPSGWGTHLIVGDILINGNASKKPKRGATAYRLGETGMTEMWSLDAGASYTTPAAYKGHVFLRGSPGGKGTNVLCVELESGKVVKTSEDIQGNICNSMIIADDRLWFGWSAYLVADPTSPDLLKHMGTYDRNSEFFRNGWATPTVAQGRVYYRRGTGAGPLYCADYRSP